jgi:hypothetical protein
VVDFAMWPPLSQARVKVWRSVGFGVVNSAMWPPLSHSRAKVTGLSH